MKEVATPNEIVMQFLAPSKKTENYELDKGIGGLQNSKTFSSPQKPESIRE
jgi:hypothetical protein